MEEKYLKSPAKELGEESLSKAIMDRINSVNHWEGKSSVAECAVAAAGFICIAEEAQLMSELTEREILHINYSNDIRQHAFNLMGYKGSQYTAVCAALLGMKKEAELLREYLTGKGPDRDEEIDEETDEEIDEEIATCAFVRKCTLGVFIYFEKLFADEISGNKIIDEPPTGFTSPQNNHDKKSEAQINHDVVLPRKIDIKKRKNMIGKTKARIQSLLKRSMKGKLLSYLKSEPSKPSGK